MKLPVAVDQPHKDGVSYLLVFLSAEDRDAARATLEAVETAEGVAKRMNYVRMSDFEVVKEKLSDLIKTLWMLYPEVYEELDLDEEG